VTPATPRGTLAGVILTEYGLHFRKDGDRWRCVERPDLLMLPGDRYTVDGQGFNSLAEAVRQAIQRVQARDIPEDHRQAWVAEIEAAYRAARAGLTHSVELRALGRRASDLAGEGGT